MNCLIMAVGCKQAPKWDIYIGRRQKYSSERTQVPVESPTTVDKIKAPWVKILRGQVYATWETVHRVRLTWGGGGGGG